MTGTRRLRVCRKRIARRIRIHQRPSLLRCSSCKRRNRLMAAGAAIMAGRVSCCRRLSPQRASLISPSTRISSRTWLLDHGGATHVPPWGKFILALLNLYDYDGVMPVPPELWLLPEALSAHPSRFWCHSRMVYLPMSYLYGIRAQASLSPLLCELRREIFCEPYEDIDWPATQTRCAPSDVYTPLSRTYRVLNQLLNGYEVVANKTLRSRANAFVLDQVRQEDENTNYVCIGPINKVLNMLCWHFAEPGGSRLAAHLRQLPEYLWKGAHGTHMQGYNSSQLWDTSLAVQAVCATGRVDEYQVMVEKAHGYIEQNQVLEDVPKRQIYYRDASKGGWPFSDRKHGWPISDCTAEGLKCAIALQPWVHEPIDGRRLLVGRPTAIGD